MFISVIVLLGAFLWLWTVSAAQNNAARIIHDLERRVSDLENPSEESEFETE